MYTPGIFHSPGFRLVLSPVLQGAVIMAIVLFANSILSQRAEAGQQAEETRLEAKISKQAGYIASLEKTLAMCLTRGDHPLTIGGELWFCGAANTGIKMK